MDDRTPKARKILAWTVTYGDRRMLKTLVSDARTTAGMWFDWLVVLSGVSEEQQKIAQKLLSQSSKGGIQALASFKQNRGQHHAHKLALEYARERGYEFILRLDDDVRFRTKSWLRKMIERLDHLKIATGDDEYRLVAAPKVVGLQHQIDAIGSINVRGQDFPCEIVPTSGGVCRLANVQFMRAFEPDLWDPVGRGDPDQVATYVTSKERLGYMVRFPDIRVNHPTAQLEAMEDAEARNLREMGRIWPWIGPDDGTGRLIEEER